MEYDDEEEFELGDGTADTEATVECPYCGEENVIAVDPGSGEEQSYVEDCQVCCRPWSVRVTFEEGEAIVDVEANDL
jgi:transcription elongation factor Elf1